MAKYTKTEKVPATDHTELINSLQVGIVINSADGEIISANPAAEKILGTALYHFFSENASGTGVQIIHEDGTEFYQGDNPAFIALRTGKPVKDVLIGIHNKNTGEKKWAVIDSTPQFHQGDTKPYQVFSIVKDSVRHSKAGTFSGGDTLFFNAYENASIGMALIGMDGRWLKVNHATCHFTGYSESELFSMTFQDITHKDDLNADLENVNKLISGEINTYEMEKRYITKKQEVVWGLLSVSLVRDNDGLPLYFISQIQNINERKLAERALKESEEKYRILVDSADSMIMLFDGNGDILFSNPNAAKTLSVPQENMIGQNILEVFHESVAVGFLKKIREVITSGRGIVLESRMNLAAGAKWFRTSIQPVKDESGEPGMALINAVDITAIIQTEEALAQSESKLKAIINSQTSYVVRTSLSGQITYMNPKFSGDFGPIFSGEEILGKSFSSLVLPHHHTRLAEIYEKCIHRPGKVFKIELDLIGKSGEHRTLLWELICLTDSAGFAAEIQSMGFDITDRKKAESELINERAFLSRMIESAPEAIVVVDSEERVIRINQQFTQLFGYGVEEAVGKYINDLVIPNYKSDEGNLLSFHAMKGEHLGIETVRKTKDNKLVDVIVSIAPVIVGGKQLGIIGVYRNVSETKRLLKEMVEAKEKAEEMNRLKTYFFANMSHELRTPFVGILGFSELLADTITDADTLELVEGIIKSSRRMMDTLNKILSLTRLEFEPPKRKEISTDLRQVIQDSVKFFEKPALQKGLYYNFENLKNPFFIRTDPKFLSEILTNLLSNAVKFTPRGGITISVDIYKTDHYDFLKVCVADTGIGIPADKHDVIWQEFRQVSEGFSRNFEGTGLGLAITQKYVHLLGGVIEVESNQGTGTTFTFEMPVSEIPPENMAKEELQAELPEINNDVRKKLLLVEDDDFSRKFITSALVKYYDLDSVPDAETALEQVRFKHYDGFLLDINLRYGMDGVALMRVLKSMEEYQSSPMVAVTAYASEADRKEFLSKGFDSYISKPFIQSSLLNLLYQIFNQDN